MSNVKKDVKTETKEVVKTETVPAKKFTGSISAIRNTMRRHEEIGETSPSEFFDVKSKIAVVLGAAEIVIKNGEATIGKIDYGKEQFKRTAKMVNENGGAFIFRGAGGGGKKSSLGNTAIKSLETVLTNNGFIANKEGNMTKDGNEVILSEKGWLVKKGDKELAFGEYGRGTMAKIKATYAKKVA